MCGIIGCVMQTDCKQTLQQTLTLLEYRGYDSVGVALFDNKKGLQVEKNVGGITALNLQNLSGTSGIGHTRWATHGKVSAENAHPHCSKNFALVHNGIIENYLTLKQELKDVALQSTTDSEILVHLIEQEYQILLQRHAIKTSIDGQIFVQAVQSALKKVEGSYAVAVLCKDFPNQVVASRYKCPLLVATGQDGAFLCSDMQAIAAQATRFSSLQEREIVHMYGDKMHFYRGDKRTTVRKFLPILQTQQTANKPVCSFMEKEIFEIPTAVESTLSACRAVNTTKLTALLQSAKNLHIVACGTSYHAGLVFQTLLQKYTSLPIYVHLASEIYANQQIFLRGDLVIALSQSGETADTLQAVKRLKKKGCKILSITNAQYSSLGALSNLSIWMRAGQEVAVAATKTYVCQLATLYFLAEKILQVQGRKLPKFLQKLHQLPSILKKAYTNFAQVEQLAEQLKEQRAMAVIGRALDLPTAKEAALKIKEITYTFAEGYAAGELKHGSLALIDKDFCILALATQKSLFSKIENALLEVQSRQGKTILCTQYSSQVADYLLPLPKVAAEWMPLVAVIPLQYLACKLSETRGILPDKPKNLAKSVTVE